MHVYTQFSYVFIFTHDEILKNRVKKEQSKATVFLIQVMKIRNNFRETRKYSENNTALKDTVNDGCSISTIIYLLDSLDENLQKYLTCLPWAGEWARTLTLKLFYDKTSLPRRGKSLKLFLIILV